MSQCLFYWCFNLRLVLFCFFFFFFKQTTAVEIAPEVLWVTVVQSCALPTPVQNLWLAARAENIGMGWVSIFHEADLKKVLEIPQDITVIAYLTIGHVKNFRLKPELAEKGWHKRLNLNDLVMYGAWDNKKTTPLSQSIKKQLIEQKPDHEPPEI